MDVGGTLVGLHRFEIADVPKDRILARDAVRPQQVAGAAGDLDRHLRVDALAHRDVAEMQLTLVFQA